MVAPYNYILPNQPNPLEAAVSGLRLGATIEEIQAARQQRAMQQQAMEAQQRQAQALQVEMQDFAKDPSAARLLRIAPMLPKDVFANVKEAFSKRDEAQQKSIMSVAQRGIAALEAKQPQIAADLFKTYADAAEQSGDAEMARTYKFAADTIAASPQTGFMTVGSLIFSLPGGKEVIESIGKVQELGREVEEFGPKLAKLKAEAAVEQTKAKYAENNALLDLQKKGWDIKALENDIQYKRESNRIAAMQAAAARESNGLKRQELQLKIEDTIRARDEKLREKVGALETGRAQIDNFLNTADRVLATPLNVVESATGPVGSRMPTLSADTADFEELVNTLGSQAFLSQIPQMKGTGALSEKEGEKLQAALQSLSLRQSPQRLLGNVREAQRLIQKARANMARQAGMPDTVPDTPAAPAASKAAGKSVDEILRELGVQ